MRKLLLEPGRESARDGGCGSTRKGGGSTSLRKLGRKRRHKSAKFDANSTEAPRKLRGSLRADLKVQTHPIESRLWQSLRNTTAFHRTQHHARPSLHHCVRVPSSKTPARFSSISSSSLWARGVFEFISYRPTRGGKFFKTALNQLAEASAESNAADE